MTRLLLPVLLSLLPALARAAMSNATLYVSTYAGLVASFSLSARHDNYILTQTSTFHGCGANPSWLTLDHAVRRLYCLDEGLSSANGSLSALAISHNGHLTRVSTEETVSGPVSAVIYGSKAGKRGLALAHYGGSAVSTWSLVDHGEMEKIQDLIFTMSKPGPNELRQEAPHPHQALLDLTGEYVLVPDLGADVVRVFAWDEQTLMLEEREALRAKSGSGPRHAAFWTPDGDRGTTYMYLVGELDSTVTGYAVRYLPDRGGMVFEEVCRTSTFGDLETPEGSAPAEIQVSPDNRFLIVSNRNDSSFDLDLQNGSSPEHSKKEEKHESSDSISTFVLHTNGSLTFQQLTPAGGRFPRHFSTNHAGNLVALGLQLSEEVVILQRDVASGMIEEIVARARVEGEVTAVIWDEHPADEQQVLGIVAQG